MRWLIAVVLSLLVGYGVGAYYTSLQWSLKWEARNLADSEAARAKEAEWQAKLNEISKDATKKLYDVRKSERAAADDRMRNQARNYASRNKSTCPADGGAPDAIEVLAELFSDADELAETLAAEADEARVRGLACEQAYGALIVRP